jgi:hypothetical protein
MAKNGGYIEYVDGSPTDQNNNQPFSGLPRASIRDEGLYFEKKHFSPRFIAPPCIDSDIRYCINLILHSLILDELIC